MSLGPIFARDLSEGVSRLETHPNQIKIQQSHVPATSLAAGAIKTNRVWDTLFVVAIAAATVALLVRLLFLHIALGDHYVYLAHHLLRGQLWVDDIPTPYPDVITWQGHKYLPFGPLPSILLIPFLPIMQLAGTTETAWVSDLFTLLNIYIFGRILGQIGIRDERRKWVLLLFFGGTVYFAAMFAGTSWYFAHIVTTTFLLLAVSEALGKKRMWLVGLFLGLAGMVRFTALFALPFFLWLIWRPAASPTKDEGQRTNGEGRTANDESALPSSFVLRPSSNKWLQYAALLVPLACCIVLLGVYNYLRFGNPLENGYSLATLSFAALAQARAQGIFSLVHVPKNLFMLLLQGPVPYPNADAPVLQPPYVQPSTWGMGLFFTSPALIYMFKARIKEPIVQACWLARGLYHDPYRHLLRHRLGAVRLSLRARFHAIPGTASSARSAKTNDRPAESAYSGKRAGEPLGRVLDSKVAVESLRRVINGAHRRGAESAELRRDSLMV